jgi:hypothetical protein
MPFLSWITAKLSGAAIKAGAEVVKSGAETAKALAEVPKTLIETEKAHLEVKELQLQSQERERLIVPATFADVKEYDPKIEQIERHWKVLETKDEMDRAKMEYQLRVTRWLVKSMLLFALFGILALGLSLTSFGHRLLDLLKAIFR